MERRRGDSEHIVVRRSGNSLTVTGISAALILALASLIFNVGTAREKIDRLEANYGTINVKLDEVSKTVNTMNGKVEMIVQRIGK